MCFRPTSTHSHDPEVLLEDPVAEEDDLCAAGGGHGARAEVGDGERAELLAVADDARHHRLQHLGRPPQRLRQEHLRFKFDISFAPRIRCTIPIRARKLRFYLKIIQQGHADA